MLKFYFNASPNPAKVALFLEESGLPYEAIPVDTRKGEQFSAELVALNPNAKVPVVVDGDVRVFDSTAILLYLSEKTGQFLAGNSAHARGELLSWLMFVASGIGPYSGQAVHFRHYAPPGQQYASDRYQYEARRHYSILNTQLASRPFLLGETYTIVDMAAWGWARAVPFVLGDTAWSTMPHLKRWFEEIKARPATVRAYDRAKEINTQPTMSEEARKVLFGQTAANIR